MACWAILVWSIFSIDMMTLYAKLIYFYPTTRAYCETLNMCSTEISWFNENNLLAGINFDVHDISWLPIQKKTFIWF